MCEYIKEFDIIDNKIQDEIINFVKSDKQIFTPSKLYSKSKDEKFIDTNERQSEFKTINENICWADGCYAFRWSFCT